MPGLEILEATGSPCGNDPLGQDGQEERRSQAQKPSRKSLAGLVPTTPLERKDKDIIRNYFDKCSFRKHNKLSGKI